MKSRSVVFPSVATILSIALLAGCSEPQQPATAGAPDENAPQAAAQNQAAADAAFAAIAPTELSLAERRLVMTPDKACNLERANGTVFSGTPIEVSKGAPTLTLSGWVANKDQREVPGEVDLRLISIDDNRAWKVQVKTGGKRDDVIALLGGDQVFANAGYTATMSIAKLPVGTYRMYTVFGDANALKVCDNGRSVLVKE